MARLSHRHLTIFKDDLMAYTDDQLGDIFDRSGGDCHLCGKRLAFKNYACHGERAAWEVDHSNAKARGGSHRLSNLLPACISCNRSKQDRATNTARRKNGMTRTPMSKQRRVAEREDNTVLGILGGAAAGGMAAGPVGALAGAIFGGIAGNRSRPR